MMTQKVTKNQGFILFLEDKLFQKLQCQIENLPIYSNLYKNNTLTIRILNLKKYRINDQ